MSGYVAPLGERPLAARAACGLVVACEVTEDESTEKYDDAVSAERPGKYDDESAAPPLLVPIAASDTLAGIALRYNTTMAAIKLTNGIPLGSLDHIGAFGDFLFVPTSAASVITPPHRASVAANRMLSIFMEITHVTSRKEALYYLAEHEFKLAPALKEFRADE